MQEKYDPAAVEKRAQTHWDDVKAYLAVEHAKDKAGKEKPKYYACSMLPYPSGKLHMGHVRNYTINDVMYRHLRMNGYNVLMPMGWDAFGLPAENAAMKNKVAPAAWTYDNIAYMKKQMQAMGLAIDWSREMAACDPKYYKWNQWLFIKMLEKGIAYRKTQVVNWDPVDQTVLANEQVIDGRGWRTGAVVEKREIPGYYLKITEYAEELLGYVQDKLPGWPERVRLMQENWIGKSEGVRFAFPHELEGADGKLIGDGRMYVFTTRPDTIMGVTFCAVAPEHPIATAAAHHNPAVASFIEKAKQGGTTEAELALKEKEGVPTGLFVTHPLTNEKVEVWVGNYVLMSYGDGAVMGVPAHDERDFAFARKYKLPIKQVVAVEGKAFSLDAWDESYADKVNGKTVNSGKYDGLGFKATLEAVAADLAAKGLGEKKTTWRLRDWGISRQRYWGTPIPIIHCDEHGAVPVPEKDLPVVLPEDCIPDGSGNPLNKNTAFLKCNCPVCGKPARRETDTMDTFVDSSWYFMRYCSPGSDDAMVDARNDYWMPMDQYIGGIEHAILHLLYARFWTKVMRDLGLVKFDEPFINLLCQGMVLNQAYSRKPAEGGKEYFWEDELDVVRDEHRRIVSARLKSDGSAVEHELTTMSKSKSNGVDPQDLIEQYGADTARLYVMFTSPPEQSLEWSDAGVDGSARFLRRFWAFGHAWSEAIAAAPRLDAAALPEPLKALRREVYTILKQIDFDIKRIQYNTVVSGAMKMLNALEGAPKGEPQAGAVVRECLSILIRVMNPVVPHITHAMWEDVGCVKEYGDLLDAPWPPVDEAALQSDVVELMLQVNGKLRGSIQAPARATKEEIEKLALASPVAQKFMEGKPAKKVVVVPGRLVNIVV
ncbi:MAG TPA: leucine--tRNA ligase [Burkholderiales bacterium]